MVSVGKFMRGASVKGKPRAKEQREITVGADKAYQVKGFIEGLRELGVVPHVAELFDS